MKTKITVNFWEYIWRYLSFISIFFSRKRNSVLVRACVTQTIKEPCWQAFAQTEYKNFKLKTNDISFSHYFYLPPKYFSTQTNLGFVYATSRLEFPPGDGVAGSHSRVS